MNVGFFFFNPVYFIFKYFHFYFFFPFAHTKQALSDPGLRSEPRLKLTPPPEGEAEVRHRKGCIHLSSDLVQEEGSTPYKQEVVKFYLS